jgi:serine protease Do
LVLGGLAGAVLTSPALLGQPVTTTAIPKEITSYRDVVQKVLPAVVSVEAKPKAIAKNVKQTTPGRRPKSNLLPPNVPDDIRRWFDDQGDFGFEMPDEIVPSHSFGSGFVIDPKGIILTNFHVVANTDRVQITLQDGRHFYSTDIKGDRKNDLAIVRVDAKTPLPSLTLGDSDAMEIGDRVLAVGAPFGLTGSVTAGIVSAKGRTGLSSTRTVYEDYLQTDAAINPGNSGGPLVNLAGQVVGINTAIKSVNGGFQGIGLAITSNLAKIIAEQLERDGVVHRGYLGVGLDELEPEAAAKLGAQEGGVVVAKIFPDSPAAKAGFQPGDIITSIGGKHVKNGRELQHIVGTLPLRKPVEVEVLRDNKCQVMKVTVDEQPDNYGVTSRTPRDQPRKPSRDKDEVSVENAGIEVSDLTPETAEQYGFADSAKGVLITDVQTGSIAAEAGLRKGLLIVKVDKKAVTSAETVQKSLSNASLAKGVLLQVQASPKLGGGTTYVLLKGELAEAK